VEFTIQRAALSAELQVLQTIADRKGALPILSHILMTTDGHRLRLTATALETTLRSEALMDAVVEHGSVCAPARRLTDVVKAMPEGMVTVKSDATNFITVTAPGSRFRMGGMAADAWPALPVPPQDATWTDVPASALKRAVRATVFAAAPEHDSKYVFKGLRLEVDGARISLAATDGHRLAYAEHALEVLTAADIAVLVPRETVDDLLRLLDADVETVGLWLGENHLYFRAGARLLDSRLLVGDFPDYRNTVLAPSTFPTFATLSSEELTASLRRTLLAADGRSSAVRMHFQNGHLNLKAETAESGESNEQLSSDWNGPQDVRAAINARYILDFLAGLGGGTVRWEMRDAATQLNLVAAKDGLACRYVVMPLSLPE
jgi:DNA polymerase-3 subunit beta